MSTILTRRHFLRGLFAMPAVVAASSLMPIRGIGIVSDWPQFIDPFNDYIYRRMAMAYRITREQIDVNMYNSAFAQSFVQAKLIATADVITADILNSPNAGEQMEFVAYAQ